MVNVWFDLKNNCICFSEKECVFYDINISNICGINDFSSCLRHLSQKNWFERPVLIDFLNVIRRLHEQGLLLDGDTG